MDRLRLIGLLKRLILQDVAYLCRRSDRLWSEPIVQTLRALRAGGGQSVFFGGTIRSLLISRLLKGRLGRPRDVDIVVAKRTIDDLRRQFKHAILRETRFGGLQLARANWLFDVWPLDR